MPKIKYKDINIGPERLAIISECNRILREFAAQGYSMTLRQVYYQLVAHDLFPDERRWRWTGTKWVRDENGTKNAEPNYKYLGDVLTDGRMCGLIDWEHMEDRTRNLQSLAHWDSPSEIMNAVARQFRVDKWAEQEYRPEVWIEKEALAGVFERVCNEYDVPFFCCRGYTSLSEMWQASQRLKNYVSDGQTPIIFHFGDHDPSGIDMTRDVDDRLATFMGGIEIQRLALNMPQIEEFQPPPNPAKLTDSRAKVYVQEYGDESWELDALDPTTLAGLVRDAIEGIRDDDAWETTIQGEDDHKNTLKVVSDKFDDVKAYARAEGWL